MATTNAWAECVIFSDNGSYEMMTSGFSSKNKEFTISNPRPCNQLTFTNEQKTTGIFPATGGVTVTATFSDGSSSEIASKKGNGTHTINLNRKIVTKLHFEGTGTLKKTLSAITLTQATYVDAPQGFTNNAWPAGTDIVGNSAQKTATIEWSDATFTWELLNNTDNQFSASFSSTGATCTYGTSNITVTYLRTKPGNHSASLKITASTGATYTIALSGVTGKYISQAAKKMDVVMNESYNPSDIFDVYYYANNNKSTINDYFVTALDPTIANYVGGEIVTNYQTGTARFLLTRNEDDKFIALNETISVEIKQSEAICYLIENKSTSANHQIGLNKEGTYSETYTLNGIGDKLSFKCKLDRDPTYYHYLTPQYSATDNGNDFQDFPDSKISTDNGNEHVRSGLNIPSGTKRIRFKRTAATAGTANFSIYEIYVSRKKDLSPQIDGDIFYLTQVASGLHFAGTFPLEWSTCCDNIRFSCDNPNFEIKALDSNNQLQDYIDASNNQGTTNLVVTYSTDTNNPDLTGTLTIYDQSQSKTITLSCEQLLQTIDWPQYFYNIEADEDGNIYEDFTLNAVARTVNGQPTNRPIHYTLDVEPADKAHLSTDANGITHLIITGVCEGFITASVDEFTDEKGKRYSASQLTRDIRVRKAGEPCNTLALRVFDQYSTHGWGTNYIVFPIGDLPKNEMTFGAHAEVGSLNNWLDVNFHMDANAAPNASGWTEKQRIEIKAADAYTWGYKVTVPENAKQVRFEAGSSLTTYINMVRIYQQEYLTANVERIELPNAIVNQQFSTTFEVDYSAVPFIQYHVTNNNNLNLQLIPSPEITNNCKDHGIYTFTLKGMSPYPQTNVEELITIFTSAGHKVEIPVVITSSLSDTYYFNQQAGNWGDLNNWQVKGTTPTKLPTASNPIVISKPLTINESELVAYGVTIENGGSVNIQPKGGLTLHAGGFTNVTENNFEVHNNLEGAGFVRVSKYFKERGGTMPKMKVRFTTKANMNNGGNKDAAWQYIGAPGAETQMQVVNTSTLYLRSEEKGWVRQWDSNASLTPFAGYAFTQKDQPSIDFTPRLVTDNQTITLTYTEGGMMGDNLWANSYMAPIDIKKLGKEDFSGAVDQTVYLYNCGSWNDWNKDQSSIKTAEEQPGRYYGIPVGSARALDATYDQTVIPPMQGVYMKANQGGGSLTLNYEKHVWNCKSNEMNRALRIVGKRTAEEDYLSSILRIRLQINSQNSGADRMYLIQDSTCTANYDNGFDAPKQMTDGLLNLYTNEACGKMEISATDNIDGIYLGFAAGEDEVYTMTFTSLIGEDLYLYDVEQDTLVGMANGETYEFAAAAKSTNDMRFQILVNPDLSDYLPNGGNGDGVTTDIYDVQTQQLWVQDKKVYIAYASANSTLEVYTISGVAVAKYAIGYAPCTLDLSNMPTGVYMLRLNDTVYKFVCK